jgi:toxin ParE1/3/4
VARTRRLRIEQEAEEDLEASVRYYRDEAGEDLALRFVDAVEGVFSLLNEHPEVGRKYESAPSPRLRELRAWPLADFPFLIFYELTEAEILIAGIVEGHQNLPEIFRKRWSRRASSS